MRAEAQLQALLFYFTKLYIVSINLAYLLITYCAAKIFWAETRSCSNFNKPHCDRCLWIFTHRKFVVMPYSRAFAPYTSSSVFSLVRVPHLDLSPFPFLDLTNVQLFAFKEVISCSVNDLSFKFDLSPPLTYVKVSPPLIGEGLGERFFITSIKREHQVRYSPEKFAQIRKRNSQGCYYNSITTMSQLFMHILKIRKLGNSLGTTLPKEVLQKLRVREGDSIFVTETPGGVHITAYNPDFEKAMEAYKKVSNKYRNALHELAK